jgi:cytidine deaminase
MFDKNEDFVVAKLGQVSDSLFSILEFVINPLQLLPLSFGPDQLPPPGAPGTK